MAGAYCSCGWDKNGDTFGILAGKGELLLSFLFLKDFPGLINPITFEKRRQYNK